MKKYYSWNDTGHFIDTLIDQLIKSEIKFDRVIGVARGGIIPAAAIASRLNIPLELIYYSSKDGNGDGKNHANIIPEFKGVNLVVDDLTDSGKTLQELKDKLNANTVLATIFHKEHSCITPDFYAVKAGSDDWIVFPWE
jgi:hypoxanthine phosphoribosyltransferase